MDEFEGLFQGLDAPRALPEQLRRELAESLRGAAPTGILAEPPGLAGETRAPDLTGLDAPRPLPPYLRARLLRDLARPRLPVQWLAVAAAVLLIAGGTTLALQRGGHSARQHLNAAAGGAGPTTIITGGGAGASSVGVGTSGGSAGGSGVSGAPVNAPAAPAAGGASSSAMGGVAAGAGSPPPYAFGSSGEAELPLSGPEPPAPQARVAGPPLLVTVIGDNPGFDRYISLLNAQGGVNGRPLQPTNQLGGVATVNLSDQPLPKQVGPVLETTYVSDALLRGDVFDVVSSPVHQAIALVNSLPWRRGQVVGIYRGTTGVWASEVPNAMAMAVRAHGATPVVMTWDPASPAPPPATVLLAMDTQDANAFIRGAASRNFHPTIAGIGSVAEGGPEGAAPNGTKVLSPFNLAPSPELDATGGNTGQTGTADIHGWLTAKILAVALWKSGATSPTATAAALHQMAGYDDGFDPPIAWRAGTNSPIADGILYTITNHALSGGGAFVRDPS